MPPFIIVFLVLVGLSLGSFVNVLIYRLPRGITLFGRSFCPSCQRQISWFDNIPILSFLFLKGKCRNCHKKISFQYPLIETIAALAAIIIYISVPNLLLFVTYYLLFIIFLAIFVIDMKHQIIPDSLVFLGLGIAIFNFQFSIFNFFAGFFAASALLLLHFATRGRGMGLGDVKLAVLGGVLVGPKHVLLWLFLAFLTGALASIILIMLKKKAIKDKIAFGPFLISSILFVFIYEIL